MKIVLPLDLSRGFGKIKIIFYFGIRIFFIFSAFFIIQCATSPQRQVQKVQKGMNKEQVLELLSDPRQKYRHHSQDHWVYHFYESDYKSLFEVIFENGIVVSAAATPLPSSVSNESIGVSPERGEYQQTGQNVNSASDTSSQFNTKPKFVPID